MHFLKLAKILVILIKKHDRKNFLTLTEEKTISEHMHRFNSHISQFLRKMRALIFLYVNKVLTDITAKHKMTAICKTKKFAKLRQISFLHV